MTEQQVKDIFKSISKKYEVSNLIISLGLEKYWRARFNSLIKGDEKHILDACCGTGNSTFAIWKKTKRNSDITGMDFSKEMLEVARQKTSRTTVLEEKFKTQRPAGPKISFIESDITNIPFEDNNFELVTVIFGIRNIIERKKALGELYRVTGRGGRILVMEFNMPVNNTLKKLYEFYLNKILVKMGKLISKNETAYSHLVRSIESFPEVRSFASLMEDSGWAKIRILSMSFNTCVIFEAFKI